MAGARQRAEALVQMARAKNERWKYFVGLEGGLDVIAGLDVIPSLDVVPELDVVSEASNRWVFLESWAYVTDGEGRRLVRPVRRGAYPRSARRKPWLTTASSFRKRLTLSPADTIFATPKAPGES